VNGDIKSLHAIPFIVPSEEETPALFYEQRVLAGIR
jgi:hypothetical protein